MEFQVNRNGFRVPCLFDFHVVCKAMGPDSYVFYTIVYTFYTFLYQVFRLF